MDKKFIMKINKILQEETAKCDAEFIDLGIANGDGNVLVGFMDPFADGSEFLVKIYDPNKHKESYLLDWFKSFRASKMKLSDFIVLDKMGEMKVSMSALFLKMIAKAFSEADKEKPLSDCLTLKNVKHSVDLKAKGELNG